jgi:hypothetical protein
MHLGKFFGPNQIQEYTQRNLVTFSYLEHGIYFRLASNVAISPKFGPSGSDRITVEH